MNPRPSSMATMSTSYLTCVLGPSRSHLLDLTPRTRSSCCIGRHTTSPTFKRHYVRPTSTRSGRRYSTWHHTTRLRLLRSPGWPHGQQRSAGATLRAPSRSSRRPSREEGSSVCRLRRMWLCHAWTTERAQPQMAVGRASTPAHRARTPGRGVTSSSTRTPANHAAGV
jgi:hypothetical protein